ncbi:MAG: hypothetical protein NVSMB49_13220 [Ktedonobacteraceae bacterium]
MKLPCIKSIVNTLISIKKKKDDGIIVSMLLLSVTVSNIQTRLLNLFEMFGKYGNNLSRLDVIINELAIAG